MVRPREVLLSPPSKVSPAKAGGGAAAAAAVEIVEGLLFVVNQARQPRIELAQRQFVE